MDPRNKRMSPDCEGVAVVPRAWIEESRGERSLPCLETDFHGDFYRWVRVATESCSGENLNSPDCSGNFLNTGFALICIIGVAVVCRWTMVNGQFSARLIMPSGWNGLQFACSEFREAPCQNRNKGPQGLSVLPHTSNSDHAWPADGEFIRVLTAATTDFVALSAKCESENVLPEHTLSEGDRITRLARKCCEHDRLSETKWESGGVSWTKNVCDDCGHAFPESGKFLPNPHPLDKIARAFGRGIELFEDIGRGLSNVSPIPDVVGGPVMKGEKS